MTFGEMHTLFDLIMDKSGAPWFNALEKDTLLNLAQEEAINYWVKSYESDEKVRDYVDCMVKKVAYSNSNTITASSIGDYLSIVAIGGSFTVTDCNNLNPVSRPTFIPPRALDGYHRNQDNTFLKATNRNPYYIQYNNGSGMVFEIKSDTTPLNVEIFYIPEPVKINGAGTPGSSSIYPYPAQIDVVNRAARKALEITESQRYATENNEIVNET